MAWAFPSRGRPRFQGSGIGISNVRERLKVVYGQDFLMKIDSQPGKGTAIRFEIPELVAVPPSGQTEPDARGIVTSATAAERAARAGI